MKNFMKLCAATALCMSLGLPAANADRAAGFTSHHLVTEKNYEYYARNMSAEEKLELREYLDYQQREPCQNYQNPPQGFLVDDCQLYHPEPPQKMAVVQTRAQPAPKVLADYEVHFAFDSAAIEPAAGNALDQVAREIRTHSPGDVTVAGHADRAGPADYNVALSKKRAQAVSDALTKRGVTNRVIDEVAFGENRPEVETGDGVALRENRRVEIQFLE